MFAILTGSCQRTTLIQTRRATAGIGPGGTPALQFDVRWPAGNLSTSDNDALWVFAKTRSDDGSWTHARLDPDRMVLQSGSASFNPAPDGSGVFIHVDRSPIDWMSFELPWLPPTNAGEIVEIRVFALEMVRIESGPFFVGDGEFVELNGHLQTNGTGAPFRVASEANLTLGRDSVLSLGNSNAYGMRGDPGEPFANDFVSDDFNDASRLVLSSEFPKGVTAFYVMKYELSQGHYAAFLNTLSIPQSDTRNPGPGLPAPGANGYTLTTVRPFSAAVPDRAMNQVSWMDAAAFADWAALRPMTELEFEKAARGSEPPMTGQFSWGNDRIARRRYSLRDANTPLEALTNLDSTFGNASWQGTHGKLDPSCASCLSEPVRGGAFETAGAEVNGASASGVLELSGNLFERVVTIGHAAGRRFDGAHGDGNLSGSGNATGPEIARWPGSTPVGSGYEITGALGSGLRGGSWTSPALRLRISDRAFAATPDTARRATSGIRLVRTDPRG